MNIVLLKPQCCDKEVLYYPPSDYTPTINEKEPFYEDLATLLRILLTFVFNIIKYIKLMQILIVLIMEEIELVGVFSSF